jgi:hypothetical protein
MMHGLSSGLLPIWRNHDAKNHSLQNPRDDNWDLHPHGCFLAELSFSPDTHIRVLPVVFLYAISSLPTHDAFENLASSPCTNPKFSRVEDVKGKTENAFLANLTAEGDE